MMMNLYNAGLDLIGSISKKIELPNLSTTTIANLPDASLAKLTFSPKPVTEFSDDATRLLRSGRPAPVLKEAPNLLQSGRPAPVLRAPDEPTSVPNRAIGDRILKASDDFTQFTQEQYQKIAEKTAKSLEEAKTWAKENPEQALVLTGGTALTAGVGTGAVVL